MKIFKLSLLVFQVLALEVDTKGLEGGRWVGKVKGT
jgi:hypothetical protein